MMVSNIQAALDSILKEWATAEGVVVAWENVGTDSDISEPHVASYMLPAETDAPTVSDEGSMDYIGVYQVSVYTQKGLGTFESKAIADSLLTSFARGVERIVDGQLVRVVKSWRSSSVSDSAWYITPVSIRYRSIV